MEITIVGAFWMIASFIILILFILNTNIKGLPQFFSDFFLFGKLKGKRITWTVMQMLEIPKSFFLYFYVVGSLFNGFFTLLTIYCYYTGTAYPRSLVLMSHLLCGGPSVQDNLYIPLLLGCLMTIQNIRRLYESCSISIYSNSTMNIFHFMCGILLYIPYPLVIMSEPLPDLHAASFRQAFGVGLFVWSSYNHHKILVALANLRLHANGKVKSLDHFIPSGDYFELVSCPHYLMEIVIYFSFAMVNSFQNSTLNCIFLFVATNQIVSGLLAHNWYKINFKDYPLHRKAVIPFII